MFNMVPDNLLAPNMSQRLYHRATGPPRCCHVARGRVLEHDFLTADFDPTCRAVRQKDDFRWDLF